MYIVDDNAMCVCNNSRLYQNRDAPVLRRSPKHDKWGKLQKQQLDVQESSENAEKYTLLYLLKNKKKTET